MVDELIKTICLFGANLPPFFMEGDPRSEAIEQVAVDLWNAGFGVLTPHLNAPRQAGYDVPEDLQRSFDFYAITMFSHAIFVMPGWEDDPRMLERIAMAICFKRQVFDSIPHLLRWRDGAEPYATVQFHRFDMYERPSEIKIAFVAGKYFVGEKRGDVLIPNRNAIHQNILLANELALRLWKEGIGVFTPHNNTHHFELKTHVGEDVYQAFDKQILRMLVHGLVVLPNWVNSAGAKKEVALAQELQTPVINSYDFESIRNWRDKSGPVHTIATILHE